MDMKKFNEATKIYNDIFHLKRYKSTIAAMLETMKNDADSSWKLRLWLGNQRLVVPVEYHQTVRALLISIMNEMTLTLAEKEIAFKEL